MWQWLFQGTWIDCTPENNKALQKRHETPTMEPIYLVNAYGELWGTPENSKLKFRIHGDDEESRTTIRIAPKKNECPIIEVREGANLRILPPNACMALFKGTTPSIERRECDVGTEKFVSDSGKLFQHLEGNLMLARHADSGFSWAQYKKMSTSRYSWEFKGPLRWELMHNAVLETCRELKDTPQAEYLAEIFSNFDPAADLTEYGPYQFHDYLISIGQLELSVKVMDNFHKQTVEDWKPFDAITSAKIERARNAGRPISMVKARGHVYMLVFDSGSGASGSDPVLIRPSRYQKILESIEEQYEESMMRTRRGGLQHMFDLLIQNNVDPRAFLMSAITNRDDWPENVPENIRAEVVGIIRSLEQETTSNFSTYVQQFMPPLLQKFKECDVRLALKEEEFSKKLCPRVIETLQDGMKVPSQWKVSWKTLIAFIWEQQSWNFKGPINTCDICGTDESTLKHCGNNKACLKCWTSTLVKTKMTCPFCRQDIKQGDLKLITESERTKTNRKRKRNKATGKSRQSMESVLTIIRKDKLYQDISEKTSFGMRKWFTILLRRGLVNIHQSPSNPQASKSFKDALKIFKLI